MSLPRVVAVAPGSAAERAGLAPGDEVLSLDGQVPRDVIQWQVLVDEADVELEVRRGGLDLPVTVTKAAGEPLGAEVSSSIFDAVQTCDNACEFCFIHQLPKGLRRSLYLKDDDYRLSFLYGNFTTLTRFTEADLERVVTERLSPLNVSIHATDAQVRARLLRNRRGATSLRWLRALLDAGIEVHGQVVVCPGVNDGEVLEDTLVGVLDRYPELATLCVVPLGVSRHGGGGSLTPPPRPSTWWSGWRRGRGASSRCSVDAWPSPPTSTTSSPTGRSRPPTPTRASPCTRTAWAWPARSRRSSPVARRRRRGLERGSSPGSTAPRPRATGPLARRRAPSCSGPGGTHRWVC
jgi:hypothetical protein